MAVVAIVIPDLGEMVAAVRVVAWLKQPGEAVAADEALVEIATDKIDAMIQAPASGVLSEVRAPAGEWVRVGAVVGEIESG